MSYDLKTLEKHLLNQLAILMTDFGYKLNNSQKAFFAETPFGWAALKLSFIVHKGADFDVTGSVGLRIHAVEEAVNESNKLLSKSEKAATATLGAEFGNIIDGKQKRWTIKSEADIRPVASDIVATFKSVGLPYIERYSDLKNTLEALSGNDRGNWLHMPIHGARCSAALALAYVLKDHARFKELIVRNTEFLKSRNDFGLQDFEALATRLSKTSF